MNDEILQLDSIWCNSAKWILLLLPSGEEKTTVTLASPARRQVEVRRCCAAMGSARLFCLGWPHRNQADQQQINANIHEDLYESATHNKTAISRPRGHAPHTRICSSTPAYTLISTRHTLPQLKQQCLHHGLPRCRRWR
jgi:hypothetical protein